MRLLPLEAQLLKGERLYRFRKLDDMLQMIIVANESVHDSPTGFDNQARDPDEAVQKALELHAQYRLSQWSVGQKKAVPGFKIPGQRGDNHKSPVGQQRIGGRSQGRNAVFQLVDIVFMVAPVAVKTDRLFNGPVPVVGNVKKVANIVE